MSDALDRYKKDDESQADTGAGNTTGGAQDNLESSRFEHCGGGQVRDQGAIESGPRC